MSVIQNKKTRRDQNNAALPRHCRQPADEHANAIQRNFRCAIAHIHRGARRKLHHLFRQLHRLVVALRNCFRDHDPFRRPVVLVDNQVSHVIAGLRAHGCRGHAFRRCPPCRDRHHRLVNPVEISREPEHLVSGGSKDADALTAQIQRIDLPHRGLAGVHKIAQTHVKVIEEIRHKPVRQGRNLNRARGRIHRNGVRRGGFAHRRTRLELFDAEFGNDLRFAVVRQMEVVHPERSDRMTVFIADHNRNLHQIHGGPENGRCVCRADLRRILRRASHRQDQQRQKKPHRRSLYTMASRRSTGGTGLWWYRFSGTSCRPDERNRRPLSSRRS